MSADRDELLVQTATSAIELANLIKDEISDRKGLALRIDNLQDHVSRLARHAAENKVDADRAIKDLANRFEAHASATAQGFSQVVTLASRVSTLEAKVHELSGELEMANTALGELSMGIRDLTNLVRGYAADVEKLRSQQ